MKFQSALKRGSLPRSYDTVDAGTAVFLSALVGALGSIIVAVIQRFRKENARDHDVVMGMLKYINKNLARTENKIDRHVKDHSEKSA
jgi:hypothetical protein